MWVAVAKTAQGEFAAPVLLTMSETFYAVGECRAELSRLIRRLGYSKELRGIVVCDLSKIVIPVSNMI